MWKVKPSIRSSIHKYITHNRQFINIYYVGVGLSFISRDSRALFVCGGVLFSLNLRKALGFGSLIASVSRPLSTILIDRYFNKVYVLLLQTQLPMCMYVFIHGIIVHVGRPIHQRNKRVQTKLGMLTAAIQVIAL